MCIAQLLFILIAVLYLTALSISQEEIDLINRSSNRRFNSESLDLSSQETNSRWMHNREVQMMPFLNAGGSLNEFSDCCPTVTEMVQPHGGTNQEGMFVELYRDGSNQQRFYEHSCHPDIVGKACLFIERRLKNHSKCEQQFSYTYALVKDTNVTTAAAAAAAVVATAATSNSSQEKYSSNKHRHNHHFNPFHQNRFDHSGTSWTLDYIRVRSGCSCVVYHKQKKKKSRKKPKKLKSDDKSAADF